MADLLDRRHQAEPRPRFVRPKRARGEAATERAQIIATHREKSRLDIPARRKRFTLRLRRSRRRPPSGGSQETLSLFSHRVLMKPRLPPIIG